MEWTPQRTCLWFYNQCLEAAEFYVALLPDSRIEEVARRADDGVAGMVALRLAGAPYLALDGGPHLRLTESVPVSVLAPDQSEIDRIWNALLADGGEAGRCGWLRDRFGLSWQILPAGLAGLLARADRDAASRIAEAMLEMGRIEIAALERAARSTRPRS